MVYKNQNKKRKLESLLTLIYLYVSSLVWFVIFFHNGNCLFLVVKAEVCAFVHLDTNYMSGLYGGSHSCVAHKKDLVRSFWFLKGEFHSEKIVGLFVYTLFLRDRVEPRQGTEISPPPLVYSFRFLLCTFFLSHSFGLYYIIPCERE